MLKDSSVFGSFSSNDLEAAQKFYGETLGLSVENMGMGLSLSLNGGTKFFIYPKPDHEPASYTVLNFKVTDIDAAVDELTKRGVKFEQYTGEIQTNEKGICHGSGGAPTIAWFKDPAGNILSVLQASGQ